jgi:hypothetical protein
MIRPVFILAPPHYGLRALSCSSGHIVNTIEIGTEEKKNFSGTFSFLKF